MLQVPMISPPPPALSPISAPGPNHDALEITVPIQHASGAFHLGRLHLAAPGTLRAGGPIRSGTLGSHTSPATTTPNASYQGTSCSPHHMSARIPAYCKDCSRDSTIRRRHKSHTSPRPRRRTQSCPRPRRRHRTRCSSSGRPRAGACFFLRVLQTRLLRRSLRIPRCRRTGLLVRPCPCPCCCACASRGHPF